MPEKTKFIKYNVETVYVGEYIDLKKIQKDVKSYIYLTREQPLVIKFSQDSYAVLTKFGAVTFWNVPAKLKVQFLKEIRPFTRSKREDYHFDEDTKVWVGGDSDKVGFEKVYVSHFGVSKIKIISYVLSQSVALERYEDEIDKSLKDVGVIVENLRTSGKALLGEKALLKRIGEVLSVKQAAMAHLALVTKPKDVWESPGIENLYNRMHSEYELRTRFNVLDEKINYLSDISQMLINFLAEKRMALLEWVVIILIAIEILIFVPIPWTTIMNVFK